MSNKRENKKNLKEKKYGFFLNSSSGKKLALTAFSKTVSEDVMHVSLIFKLGSSTFHRKKKTKQNKTKKTHCEILGVGHIRVCCVLERALQ